MQERALRAGVDIIVATPGTADRSHAAAERRPERRRAAGARRGRPHDGHGLLARRAADHRGDAQRAADAALLGDDARRCGAVRARDRARAEVRPGRVSAASRRSRSRTAREIDARVGKARLADRAPAPPGGPGAGVHRARRSAPSGWRASSPSAGIRCAALHAEPDAGSAARGRRRISRRTSTTCWSPPTSPPAASTSTASTPSSTTRCPTRPTRTCIASAGPGAPTRWARRSRSSRQRSGAALALLEKSVGVRLELRVGCLSRFPARLPPRSPEASTAPAVDAPAQCRGRDEVQVVPLAPSAGRRHRSAAATATCCRWPARPASIPKRGARTARSSSSAARPRSASPEDYNRLLGRLKPAYSENSFASSTHSPCGASCWYALQCGRASCDWPIFSNVTAR